MRIIFAAALLGAGGFVAWRGGLGWPGIERLQERDANPRMLKLVETFGEQVKPR